MNVIQFPRRRHDRASTDSRAAKAVIFSAVNPDERATRVVRIADHHSAGMLSRCSHLRAADGVAPISAAIASAEPHNPITARKEVGAIIESSVGQIVLTGKATLSRDWELAHGINCRMAPKQPATAFTKAFQARTIAARRAKRFSQIKMAQLLSDNLEQGTYKQYETRPGSMLPHEYVARFIAFCDIDFEWLFTGIGKAPTKTAPSSTRKPLESTRSSETAPAVKRRSSAR